MTWVPFAPTVFDALIREAPVRPRPRAWELRRLPDGRAGLPDGAWNVWTCIMQGKEDDVSVGQAFTPEAAVSVALAGWAETHMVCVASLDAVRRFRRRFTN